MASDRTWSTGVFDCSSDWHSCCLTCWCPCVAFGRISEILDKGSSYCCVNGTLYTLLGILHVSSPFRPFYSCCYRTKLREQYLSGENHCNDFWIHCFCHGCALCQEYRELQNRGFDMSAGWKGNPHMHNKAVSMAPVVEGEMKR
ncbi:cell number regulator 2-like [Quercus robur]|uniref:cell number regulator 2-like n=1 Tax=Quercus robur TaxID=38942 RepID=UPI002161BF25|nr:cell number regulator 2-like [Quercus robur]